MSYWKAVNLRVGSDLISRPSPRNGQSSGDDRPHCFFSTIWRNELEALNLSLMIKSTGRLQYLAAGHRDYPYIKVTLNELYPRIVKAFRIGADLRQGARYFGPYRPVMFTAPFRLCNLFPSKPAAANSQISARNGPALIFTLVVASVRVGVMCRRINIVRLWRTSAVFWKGGTAGFLTA